MATMKRELYDSLTDVTRTLEKMMGEFLEQMPREVRDERLAVMTRAQVVLRDAAGNSWDLEDEDEAEEECEYCYGAGCPKCRHDDDQ